MTFSEPRLTKLLDLLKDPASELVPEFTTRSESYCRYPIVEATVEMNTRHANQLLEDLVRGGHLAKHFYNKVIFCPVCNSQDLRFVRVCPKCNSAHIVQTTVFEHITCGNLAPEGEYRRGPTYVCPKCEQELRLLDSDYRMPGIYFKCLSCGELTANSAEKWRCNNCQEELKGDELREVLLYSYRLSEVPAERRSGDGLPRSQLESFLTHEGYDVQTEVKVAGRSGAVHEIDLLATKNSGAFEHRIVVGFARANGDAEIDSEEVIKLYAKAYDVNAQDIVLIALPRLSADAQQFANHYRIKVLAAPDLENIKEKLLV